jgi:ankyrin repeat protein
MKAVKDRAPEVVRLLLERGANPNQLPKYGGHYTRTVGETTALILASKLGSMVKVKLLIEFGADPTLKDVFGYDAHRTAAENGRVEIATWLSMLKQEP